MTYMFIKSDDQDSNNDIVDQEEKNRNKRLKRRKTNRAAKKGEIPPPPDDMQKSFVFIKAMFGWDAHPYDNPQAQGHHVVVASPLDNKYYEIHNHYRGQPIAALTRSKPLGLGKEHINHFYAADPFSAAYEYAEGLKRAAGGPKQVSHVISVIRHGDSSYLTREDSNRAVYPTDTSDVKHFEDAFSEKHGPLQLGPEVTKIVHRYGNETHIAYFHNVPSKTFLHVKFAKMGGVVHNYNSDIYDPSGLSPRFI